MRRHAGDRARRNGKLRAVACMRLDVLNLPTWDEPSHKHGHTISSSFFRLGFPRTGTGDFPHIITNLGIFAAHGLGAGKLFSAPNILRILKPRRRKYLPRYILCPADADDADADAKTERIGAASQHPAPLLELIPRQGA